METLLTSALALAAQGFAVFPLAPRSKLPLIAKAAGGHGCLDATRNEATIRAWWARSPHANIGLATGAISGVWVLDVDKAHNGYESLESLAVCYGALPVTRRAITPSGGMHIYFAWNPSSPVRGRVRMFADGLDTRGVGNYVVAPDSLTDVGEYVWVDESPVAPAPMWLLRLVCPTQPAPLPTQNTAIQPIHDAYAAAALRSESARVRSAPNGARNNTLNRAAFALGQLVGAGALTADAVTGELLNAATANGLGEREAQRTIRSGLQSGEREPRAVAQKPRRFTQEDYVKLCKPPD